MKTISPTLRASAARLYESIGRRPIFYILSVLSAVISSAVFVLSMGRTCYYTETSYTIYGSFDHQVLIPEMVGIMLLVLVCCIAIEVAGLYMWTAKFPIRGEGPMTRSRRLSVALATAPSLSVEEEAMYSFVSSRIQSSGRFHRAMEILAML